MATTSIWAVKGWLGQVVIYIENPEKTVNPAYYKDEGATPEHTQGLSDVISYATQSYKTQSAEETAEVLQHFITGVNCRVETARNEMMATKKHFGKTEGVVAYHGYQSFAPGEAIPEMAHEIGVKLAERLWGDRYQIIVTTHLDKANHLHNHFVLNNVSMVDGRKYYRSNKDYWQMRQESDALCREYGLSVIEEPKPGKAKHYSEWKAEKEGRQTGRGMVKSDVDTAIRQSMTERQFWDSLRKMGYEIKIGKDISVRLLGKERFVRLRRNFGDDYSIESIRRRILAQTRPERKIIPPNPPKQTVNGKTIHNHNKLTGLRALYFYYLYRLGVLPKKRETSPKRVYFLYREDIRFIQNISREARLLARYGIDTLGQLTAHKEKILSQINTVYGQRQQLRNQARSIRDEDKLLTVKSEITALSEQLKELRREVRLCEDIETRSVQMRDKVRMEQEQEELKESKGKEPVKNEPFRGRR